MRTVVLLIVTVILSSLVGSWPAAVVAEDSMSSVVAGNTAFGLDLYTKLRATPGNQFFSPLSISTALAMTYGGARGETATQMAKVLHFLSDEENLHVAFARLRNDLQTEEDAKCRFVMANRLWGQEGAPFLSSYTDLTQLFYDAPLARLNFAQSKRACETINRWVEKQTAEKIRELLRPDMIDRGTVLVLTNAVYFLGEWNRAFASNATKEAPFYLDSTRTVETMMMHRKDSFRLRSVDGVQILEMPYQGLRMAMVVILPEARDGLAAVEASLSAERLTGWLVSLTLQEVNVSLPRFTMASQFNLVEALKSLGMTLPFSPGMADFSGMDGQRDLAISKVIHKAYVHANEKGTEAAAATATIVYKGGPMPGKPPAIFRADHPFLFLIRDTKTGSILFFGRLANPNR